MKTFLAWSMGGVLLLPGCAVLNLLGYYKYQPAEKAPPTEAEQVRYPASFEGGPRLDGPMMNALHVAMEDFMPPGVRATGDDADR
ncbi:hypothetical protein [Archangium primigenium]|uniref:hypothetical protein n=1 Tax=[Archangium] primigenium TaxID=2792470 RepID=UPI00195EBEEF|nr:hypothetical protein [Archangium primigenium]MBM7118391.1 hypothetical protein [Archangium primigenium]